jgi:hypothetical protein
VVTDTYITVETLPSYYLFSPTIVTLVGRSGQFFLDELE